MALLIYMLTYFNLIKWRIRYIPERIFSGTDIYAFKFKNYNIKLNHAQDNYYIATTHIIIDNFKKRKRRFFRNNYINMKLRHLLENSVITDEYFKSTSYDFIDDKNKMRECKIKLLKKELIVID